MRDFLWDSPIYQEVIGGAVAEAEAKGEAKGREEGKAEGVETGKMQALSQTRKEVSQSLLELVSARFPTLKGLARKCVNAIDDTSILLHLLVRVGMATTEQEARAELTTCLTA